MSESTQTEALRLADELCAAPERSRTSFEAAAELRRLFELAYDQHSKIYGLRLKVLRVEALNVELLEALRKCSEQLTRLGYNFHDTQ